MASKYYAVKSGRRVGIFRSWDECQKQIKGYSGAVYKSFKNKDDAQNYMTGSESEVVIKSEKDTVTHTEGIKKIIAYIDGSYSTELKRYSAGIALFDGDKRYEMMNSGNDENLVAMRNVAGELMGAIVAMDWVEKTYEKQVELELYYDYEGIERWANAEWKANKIGTKSYQVRVNDFRKIHKLNFVKVRAHTGNEFNELADRLAARAMTQGSSCVVADDIKKVKADYMTLLTEIVKDNKPQKKKNEIHFTFGELVFRESDIMNLIKVVWKKEGHLIKNIVSTEINIDIEAKCIQWEVVTKEGLDYKRKLCLG